MSLFVFLKRPPGPEKNLKTTLVEEGFSALTRGLGASIIKQERNYTESVYILRRPGSPGETRTTMEGAVGF